MAMVSGDRQPVAIRVAQEIGCEEAKGECLPQNKVEFVRAMKAKGYQTLMVSANPTLSQKSGLWRGFDRVEVAPDLEAWRGPMLATRRILHSRFRLKKIRPVRRAWNDPLTACQPTSPSTIRGTL